MIANPAIPSPAAAPLTLNDLRAHSSMAEEPSSTSAMTFSGLILAVVLAIGAFIWLDPLRLFTPTEASPPAPAFVPLPEPPRPIERQEIIAPPTPITATKSNEIPVPTAPVVQAPHVLLAPVLRPRATSLKPESRGNLMDKTNTTVLQASPKQQTAPSVLLTKPEEKAAPPLLPTKPEEKAAPPLLPTKPEEKTDAPIALKLGDDTKNAPNPAATKDQTPVTE